MNRILKPGDITFYPVGAPLIDDQPDLVPQHLDIFRIEPETPRDRGRKRIYSFDQSITRLRAVGYDRHPLPRELFDLLLRPAGDDRQRALIDDLSGETEWLDLALEMRITPNNRSLITYWIPENLKALSDHYDWTGGWPRAHAIREYDLTGKELSPIHFYSFTQLPPEIVEDIIGRPLQELPSSLLVSSGLRLPPPDEVWPTGVLLARDRINIITQIAHHGSRGVMSR